MIQFDEHIFQMGWNHQLDKVNFSWWAQVLENSLIFFCWDWFRDSFGSMGTHQEKKTFQQVQKTYLVNGQPLNFWGGNDHFTVPKKKIWPLNPVANSFWGPILAPLRNTGSPLHERGVLEILLG